MRKEIDKAVETFHRIAFGTGKNGRKTINDNQLASLVTVLTELLLVRYKNNWYPENPVRGSGYRCLRLNSQCMDPTIVESLIKSEISIRKELRNMELTIWVDPGVVSIRIGEDGSIGTEEVEMDPPLSRKDSTSEDEAYSSRSPSPITDNHPLRSHPSTPSTKNKFQSPAHPSSSAYNNVTPKISQRGVIYHRNISPPSTNLSSSSSSTTTTPPPATAAVSSRRSSPVLAGSPHHYHHHHHQLQHQHRHTPSPPTQDSASRIPSPQQYSRPKSLFRSQENGGNGNYPGYYTKEGMMAAMSMHMPSGVMQHQGNYLDIPAQA